MIRRLLLLLVLVPLLLFGYQLVQHDVWLTTSDWVISRDGTRLWTLRYRSGSNAPYVLQLWDLEQKRLIRSRRTAGVWLTPSPDEEQLIIVTGGGGWQVVDAETLAPVRTFTTPLWIVGYLGPEYLLAMGQGAGSEVHVLHNRGDLVARLPPSHPTARPNATLSRDGKTIAVSSFGGTGPDSEWTVYRFESGQLQKVMDVPESVAGGPFAISSDGKYLVSSDQRAGANHISLALRRIGEEQPLWSATLENLIGVTFISQGDVIVTSHQDGTVRLWAAANGKEIHQWRNDHWVFLGEPWEDSGEHLVIQAEWWPGTGRRFPIAGGPIVIRDVRTGRLEMELPMSAQRYIGSLAAVSLGIVVWSVVWIVVSSRLPRSYPLYEIAFIQLVLLVLPLSRMILSETGLDMRRPAAWMLIAQVTGLTCAAMIYLVLSRWGWALRIAAGTAFLAIAAAVMLSVWKDETTMWHIVIGATVLITLLVAALLLLRRHGYQLERQRAAQSRHESHSQFTLRDMMILAGAIGGFFAAARFFAPEVVPLWLLEFIALEAISYALIALVGLWAVFGPQPAWVRWSLFAALAAGSFVVPFATFYNSPLLPWWWYFATHTLAAVHLAWTLVALRAYGYHFVRSAIA